MKSKLNFRKPFVRILILLIILLTYQHGQSQTKQDYYLVINEGVDLGIVSSVTNPDETVTIATTLPDFSSFLNSKQPYHFKQSFPGIDSDRLKRLYCISLNSLTPIADFVQRDEIEEMIFLEKPVLFEMSDEPIDINTEIPILSEFYPNDYTEIIFEGLPNTALELIKAPLAWTITQGNPNVYVAVVDGSTDVDHEDLQGQVVQNLNIQNLNVNHGTAVSSLVAAKTNNGIGMASIGFNTKIITLDAHSPSRVWEASRIPGVKVINCSWGGTYYNADDDNMYQMVADSGILVVAAAHNKAVETYYYPASYNSTLSVTTVGARYPIGYYHSLGANALWPRSWKDCHYFRPDTGTGHNVHNDKVDVCSPNMGIISARSAVFQDSASLYTSQTNTSAATPIVSGLAALIYGINPNFTAQEVKDIIKNTADDIYHIPYNQEFLGKLGTGRINAYRAVKTAKCLVDYTPGVDLAIQDSDIDDFTEPNSDTEHFWRSKDIWVRNQNDGTLTDVHQNPIYTGLTPNYAYVRVTNNSCDVSSGTDEMKLYWSRANTSLAWPQHWDGSLYMTDTITGEDILMGAPIGTVTIPALQIGESKILEFPWSNLPNPNDYINLNNDSWNFCLLARIESTDDPMTFPEISTIGENVKNNNNIAMKNITAINILSETESAIGAVVAVGNPYNQPASFNLEFFKEGNELGGNLYEEAEISITMDDVIFNAWNQGGKKSENFDLAGHSNKIIVQNNEAKVNNIELAANEIGTIYVSFNFLTKELSNKGKYVYHLTQSDVATNEIIGGETFEIRKPQRQSFIADAGDNEKIDKNESVVITASDINESATYNWYDTHGNLIYTGTDLIVSPEITQTYMLEVISNIDGFKDYDQVVVTVNPYDLKSLVPNPTASQVTVNYDIDGASSAYVMLIDIDARSIDNYILDVTTHTTTLDVSSFPTGLYSVILVCDGEIQETQMLIKQ